MTKDTQRPIEAKLDEDSIPQEIKGKSLKQPPSPLEMPIPDDTLAKEVSGASDFSTTLDFAKHEHIYIRDFIRLADQKIAFLFTISSALLVFLHSIGGTSQWLRNPSSWSFIDCLAFISTLVLSFSIFCAICVVWPRLFGSKRGLVFWESVADFDSNTDYAYTVIHKNRDELNKAILTHCYDLSIVARAKYKVLNLVTWSAGIGVFFTVIFLILSGKTP